VQRTKAVSQVEEECREMPSLPSKLKFFDKSNSWKKFSHHLNQKVSLFLTTAGFEALDVFSSFQMPLLPELTTNYVTV